MNTIRTTLEAVTPLDAVAMEQVAERWDGLIKPPGSLGMLEEMVIQLAGALQAMPMGLPSKALLILADTEERPLWPMFGIPEPVVLTLADGPAGVLLTSETILSAIHQGMEAAVASIDCGAQVLGIAQTVSGEAAGQSLATALLAMEELEPTLALPTIIGLLCRCDGGRLAAVLLGIILACAARRVIIVLDGLMTACAALAAYCLNPVIGEYLMSVNLSDYPEHAAIFKAIGRRPGLLLHVSDGGGVGAALTVSLLEAGVKALREMGTFAEVGVSIALQDLVSQQDFRR